MNNQNNWTIEEIQSELEDLIYRCNSVDSKEKSSLGFVAREELTEEEETKLDEYRENINDLGEAAPDFYAIQDKAMSKASMGVKLESHDSNPSSVRISFSSGMREFSSLGKGKPNKELFKNLIVLGWKITKYRDFEYKCHQEDVFNEDRKIAQLIFNTIQLFDMYSWEGFTEEGNE